MQQEIPHEYQEACEQIREHLVSLRGGAPFMSPADVIVLLDWLDSGVGVVPILLALERLAEARKKNRSRAPFTLAKAKRHLGQAPKLIGFKPLVSRFMEDRVAPAAGVRSHPFRELADFLREDAARDAPQPERLRQLASDLEGLQETDAETLAQKAIGLVRSFHLCSWLALDSMEREGYIREALLKLAPGEDAMKDVALQKSAEEAARAKLREDYPLLNPVIIWELVKA